MSKRTLSFHLAAIIAVSATIIGCGEKQTPPPPAASATSAPARTKEQAMTALMSLPELKAWSARIEKSSGGKLHGALMEYDPTPKRINGKSYWQLSFVENGSDAARPWESFLVSASGDEILVEDPATDTPITLEQWRQQKRPMERSGAD
jgi:hypothetical protein